MLVYNNPQVAQGIGVEVRPLFAGFTDIDHMAPRSKSRRKLFDNGPNESAMASWSQVELLPFCQS